MVLRNRTRYGDYDKFYQNVFRGRGRTRAGTQVSISAYNNATAAREPLQSDRSQSSPLTTGAIKHKLLTGLELGRQETDNFRNTGYFDTVALAEHRSTCRSANPRTTLPVSCRQSATDADNHGTAKMAAVYVQDEIVLSKQWQVVAGLRYDNFKVDFRNNRTASNFSSSDDLFSPRAGLVFKPIEVRVAVCQLLADVSAARGRAAQSRCRPRMSRWIRKSSRTTRSARSGMCRRTSPSPPRCTVGAHQCLNGDPTVNRDSASTVSVPRESSWRSPGALPIRGASSARYAYQDGEILTDQTATLKKGATLGQVPENTFSLWNRYDFTPRWGVGLGVMYRDEMFAATENIVTPASQRRPARLHASGRRGVLHDQRSAARAAQRREPVRRRVLCDREQQHEHHAGIAARSASLVRRELLDDCCPGYALRRGRSPGQLVIPVYSGKGCGSGRPGQGTCEDRLRHVHCTLQWASFVKNKPFHRRLGFAFAGILHALRQENSFRTQAVVACVVLGGLFYLRPAPGWWAAIILAVVLVLAAELMNTALELLVDHLHPEQHSRIKLVKDCAAGAVLVTSIGAIGVAIAFLCDFLG